MKACFAPSNVFYVSKKWLDINEDFGTCFSHDASQCDIILCRKI